MGPETKRWSASRKRWTLIGGVVVFVVAFSLVESLVGTEPTSEEGSTSTQDPSAPALPEVRRLEDGEIEIRLDFFRRSSIRLGDKDEEQILFDCLTQGIEQTFGEGAPEGWDGKRVREETQRIQNECMGFPERPSPPDAP